LPSREEVFSLHRYFLQANQMRTYYDARLVCEGAATVDDDKWTQQWIDLSLWYACLYVVMEGWRELGLSDSELDDLLASPHVELLRRFRNGVAHYQARYWDDRFKAFLMEGADSADWARSVNSAFGRVFLEWFQAHRVRRASGA
jgi:hypothetical protein